MFSLALCNIFLLTIWLNASSVQSQECGYNSAGLEGSITGPLASGDIYQSKTVECEWTITVPPIYKIVLEFVKFNIYGLKDGECTGDWLIIKSLKESGDTKVHGVFCGSLSAGKIITSDENQLRIKYYFKGYNKYVQSYFTFKYKAVLLKPLEIARLLIENKDLKNENLPKAVSSLFLVDETYFKSGSSRAEKITTRFRLQLGEDLVRNFTRPLAAGDLALRVSGLLAVCINPRSFYGVDIVYHLRKYVNDINGIPNPYIYLTLCNAGDEITQHDVKQLTAVVENQRHEMFWLDYQAMAVLSLVCIRDRDLGYNVTDALEEAMDEMISYQLNDGGFGSLQTTALVIQALTAAEANETLWSRKSAMNFINKAKQSDGSFGTIQNLYALAPVLSGKTLLYLNSSKCNFQDDLNEIRTNHSKTIQLVYSVWIGEHVDTSSTVTLKAPKGTKFFDFMRLASNQDEKFRLKWINMKNSPYVYEIGGITNDPSSGRYWTLYTGTHVMNIKKYDKGLEHYVPEDGDMAVMWYTTVAVEQ